MAENKEIVELQKGAQYLASEANRAAEIFGPDSPG